MGTQKSQLVNIIVNLDFPENWTEAQRSTWLEHWLAGYWDLVGPVRVVKKLSDTEELQESSTPSVMTSTECSVCGNEDCPGAPRFKGICGLRRCKLCGEDWDRCAVNWCGTLK